MTLRSFLFNPGDFKPGADVGLLVLRVGAGLSLALAHGLGKMPPSDGFIGATESMGFPLPVVFAWAAGLSEFVGGLLIALGLVTRPAAVFVAITMAVARLGAHGSDPFGDGELSMVYFLIAVAIALIGAGRWSLDRILWRRTATLRGARL